MEKKKNFEEQYIVERIDDQINWYHLKADKNKKRFIRSQVIVIVFSTMIPFLVGYIDEETWYVKHIIGALAEFVAIVSALMVLLKFQEKWSIYRTTAERLKHEKYLFRNCIPPYETERRFTSLVQRTEEIISDGNAAWREIVTKTNPH